MSDETKDMDDTFQAEPPEGTDEALFKGLDRYELVGLLGKGGMGRVFKAYDPRLKRHVALKFILGESPGHAQRFLHEAQAQARVEHEHVCKIYEAGLSSEKPYIAMQYIDGSTLNRLYREMTLEDKVAAMRDVAEGIHAAHRLGLIHRDIKPGNIMVERRDKGWHPYVMDFGLARTVDSAELTQAGFIVGTPVYMSPEQASGDRNLDRRSDVYSLGATLYTIVSGKPPFEGATPMEVLSNIANKEPAPIRHHDRDVPRELETIIFKCLEKDPAHRYESARMLADDLQCFLDGEPIQARPAGPLYRAYKKMRKSPVASAVAAAALIVALVLGVLAVEARRTAQERAAAAQQFGQDVERIDSVLRYARMLPIHSVQRETAIARQRMKDIEAAMSHMGDAARGPGAYAIGRGHLALHEYAEARARLDDAWSAGYRTPEAAYARGLALGMLYQQELERAERTEDREQREEKVRAVEKELRDPALQMLREAGSAGSDSAEYGDAFIAFQEKKYDQAERLAKAAIDRLPWMYEALRLQGEISLRRARDARDRGDFEGARKQFAMADERFRGAIAMAPSDSETYDRLAVNWLVALAMELYYTGGDPEPGYRRVLETTDHSLQVDPRNAGALVRRSQAATAFAEYQSNHGEDTTELEAQAIRDASSALAIDTAFADAYTARASAYHQQANSASSRGGDPRPSLDLAVADFLKSNSIRKSEAVYNDLGFVYRTRAEYEMERGLNPVPNLNLSIESYEAALKLNPRNAISFNNLGISYDTRGLYELEHGSDPGATLQLALQNYRKAAELSPGWASPLSNQGNSYLYLAQYQQRKGADPMPNIRKALECFQGAVKINPNRANFQSNTSEAAIAAAAYSVRSGKDPDPWLKQAEEATAKARAINDEDYYFPLEQAHIEILRARWSARNGADPSAALQRARAAVAQAMKLNPEDADTLIASAEITYVGAVRAARRGLKPQNLEPALAAAEQALKLSPDHARALAVKGALLQLQSGGKAGGDLLEQALKLDPSLRPDFE